MNSSFVSVPVLSKQQISILPAKGIRKGSMQTIRLLCKKNKDELMFKESSIGNSAGTTEVIIIIQRNNNL